MQYCYYMEKPTIILLLRGHIRDSFKDNKLFNFVSELQNIYNVKLYIHTWNVYSTNLSWRKVNENNNNVTVIDIETYFAGLNSIIQCIVVDDDSNIVLLGDITGNIYSTQLPKLAWKRMWYGIHKIIEIIKDNEDPETIIVNTRFDLFNNSYSYKNNIVLLDLIKQNLHKQLEKNVFLTDNSLELIGIDNYFLGNSIIMHHLINNFHTNLDNLHNYYKKIFYQEVTVFYENNQLFDVDNLKHRINIDAYFNPYLENNNVISMKFNNKLQSINVNNSKNTSFTEKQVISKESAIIKEKGLNYVNYLLTEPQQDDKQYNYNLNRNGVRERPTIIVKPTVSNWHGFGKKT